MTFEQLVTLLEAHGLIARAKRIRVDSEDGIEVELVTVFAPEETAQSEDNHEAEQLARLRLTEQGLGVKFPGLR